ncbi:MAG: type secretion protein [Deltaproteobacteria bacterium]|nr:type secretion protein [Deltaproteobacteria bacterium]
MDINELGAIPIPGTQPAGSDIRSDEKFEKLSREVDKMSSPSASGAIDWKKVVDLSSDILANSTKDLLVASYLSIALVKNEGLRGLATGVHVWRDMLTTYWDTLFPTKKRMRGRLNAIDWWLQKTSAAVRDLKPEKWKQEEIDSLYGDLDAIDTFFRENIDDAPPIGPLMSIVGSALAPVEEKAVDDAPLPPQPAEPTKTVTAPTAAKPAPVIGPAPSGDDPEPFIKHALDTLRSASALLMKKDTPDGLYFRMNRAISWMTISAPPPSHGGRTMIEAPDEDIRDLFKNMHQSGNWKNLLTACESRIPQYLFWLDLGRYICEALGQLGYKTVAKEIAGLTKLYVERLSGIEKLTFADGTPFADQATRQWLSDIGGSGSGGSSSSRDDDAVIARIENDMTAAKSLADSGNIAAAIGQLRDALTRAPSVRERFIRQVRFCRFLRENNQNKLSWPYFREIVEIIDKYRISDWEPALAAEACDVILAGIASANGNGEFRDLGQDIFRRLSLLDPVKAMEYA